ncbi:stage 0 sporulation protein B (sporulation initiation phosphotransferase) [Cytobacillus horneckiae]|uniref:sporulation initiation phosphotransferase B n=2 Tax=Cytobacillus horneckiae TaxID=549687 RepID=UPI0008261EA7|nr:sporulation initiation phosphotransferase B [Cytobacillus horneckiae]MBN6887863.1 sporulation initiation phosphotransferase B [Cytobacillus horneckiae]MCM3179782.1 sporulation initiation phosphotransferase B [Cytobacillus horneckiae]MEC1155169.1 sporulation initiation phosphotransferase B [Cytobacillus horneckiae]MED2936778.1 sporulation initiation phosphotransferase B [Cytobacillus horneckiae]
MEKDWDMIEVLRHTRHDWLNKIQLIKGNLALNKVDRAKEIIDEIVVEAQQEAKLSNLHLPEFASLLFTYNWENHMFQLEYDVLEEIRCGKLDDKSLANWTRSFFSCLNHAIQPFNENHLSVSIEPQKQGVRFFFDFSGIIIHKKDMKSFFETIPSALKLTMQSLSTEELSFDVFMNYS